MFNFSLRPHDPIEFLAYYLLTKNPYTQNHNNILNKQESVQEIIENPEAKAE